MNWFTWLLVGFALGWIAKAAIVEWRMRMLSDYVMQTMIEMREDWKPKA